jgi:hypothetical protein
MQRVLTGLATGATAVTLNTQNTRSFNQGSIA